MTPPLLPAAHRVLMPILAAAGVACAKSGTEPNLVDISGHWTFVEQFTDVVHQVTCADTGSYEISQTANGFTGSYAQRGACHGPGINADNTDSGTVVEGRVLGRTVKFKAPNCSYDGQTPLDRNDRLDGHVICTIGDPTITYNFSGLWSAVR
jgi:hypothetical protein